MITSFSLSLEAVVENKIKWTAQHYNKEILIMNWFNILNVLEVDRVKSVIRYVN